MPAAWGLFKTLRKQQQVVAVLTPRNVLLPESFEDESTGGFSIGNSEDSADDARTGAELWKRARRRVQVYVATKRMFGDVQKIYGVDQTDQTEEQEVDILRDEALRRRFFWLPDSGFRQRWDVLLVALLAYIGTVTPFREAFGVQTETWTPSYIFDILVDIFFISDVFVVNRVRKQLRVVYVFLCLYAPCSWDIRGCRKRLLPTVLAPGQFPDSVL